MTDSTTGSARATGRPPKYSEPTCFTLRMETGFRERLRKVFEHYGRDDVGNSHNDFLLWLISQGLDVFRDRKIAEVYPASEPAACLLADQLGFYVTPDGTLLTPGGRPQQLLAGSPVPTFLVGSQQVPVALLVAYQYIGDRAFSRPLVYANGNCRDVRPDNVQLEGVDPLEATDP